MDFAQLPKEKELTGKHALSLLVFCLALATLVPALPGGCYFESFDDHQSLPVVKDKEISLLQILFSSWFRTKAISKTVEVFLVS